jgi:hypothetical protein
MADAHLRCADSHVQISCARFAVIRHFVTIVAWRCYLMFVIRIGIFVMRKGKYRIVIYDYYLF